MSSSSTIRAQDDLKVDLDAVAGTMDAALAELQSPFDNFVQRQYRQMSPLVRAAVVLAVGATTGARKHRQRFIDLGAAIEMLYLAVHVHTQLLPGSAIHQNSDRSLMGSAILAGDFCFSRASSLAVRTDSPAVVDLFAQALKHVSEGHLRQLFHAGAAPYDENRELFISGAAAALSLAHAGVDDAAVVQQMVDALADVVSGTKTATAIAEMIASMPLSPSQQRVWLTVLDMAGQLPG
ncbi:MAG: polyprenyl synthetase family protein [Anaerolineales bacterium]|nr:polyprenyl synthetase family protein [Anaerolineales bacterium]